MNGQRVIYLSIALATIAIIILATARSRWVSPNTENAVPQTPQHPAILYSITDLGTLGGNESHAYGINNVGQVVGSSLTEDGKKHAFIWDSINGMQDLDPDTRFNNLTARKINNSGQVVGTGSQPQNTEKRQGFVWDRINGMQYWNARSISGINDAGQIVGDLPNNRAALWNSPNDVRDFGLLKTGFVKKGRFSRANRINNAAQVIGYAESCEKWPCGLHAFLWDSKNGMRDLGTLGGKFSWASGINDLGQVVGISYIRSGDREEKPAFLWEKGKGMRNLGTLNGKNSNAIAINNAGTVVGRVMKKEFQGVAFIWDKTRGLQDLNMFIDPKVGWKLVRADDINEQGWIVGTGWFNGNKRAFLLTPEASKK